MTNYQGNADKDKKKLVIEKKIEKVVVGDVVQRPKPVVKRMRDTFFGGDFKMAMTYVAADVLLPALRNLIWDSISKGSERMIFGESGFRRHAHDMRGRTQYNQVLPQAPLPGATRDPRFVDPRLRPTSFRTGRREVNDIVLATKVDADNVVSSLYDIISQYEVVSLADLYELLGQPFSPIDNKWGWTFLGKIEVRQIREGYLIELPTPEEI